MYVFPSLMIVLYRLNDHEYLAILYRLNDHEYLAITYV